MALDLVPRSFWNISSRIPALFDDGDWQSFLPASGLTISEGEHDITVEAAVPGISPDTIEVTYDQGVLWIRGERTETDEEKKRKYYRQASTSYTYRVAVPGSIDPEQEPDISCRNGIMKAAFKKRSEPEPKKLPVRAE